MRFSPASVLLFSCACAGVTFCSCGVSSPSGRASASLASLDLEAKAAQVLLIGAEGTGLPSAETRALLERMPVGGVVLFGSNLTGESRAAGLYTAALQDAARSGAAARKAETIPLIVAIDHEGGSVFRFKGDGITRIPPASEVGERGPRYASLLGRAAGAELRALGINMALAPVVELLSDENEAFLGSRSYGRSAPRTDAAAGAYIAGLQSELVAAVAKHFPGNAGEDPHKVLPELRLARRDYERDCLPRFASAIRKGVSSVMLSHVVFTALDPGRPSSLSPVLVRGELRRRLGFRGVAITDDLGMRALSATRGPERSAVEALAAGADLLMLVDMRSAPGVRDAIVAAVREGRLPIARLDEAARRVLELKYRFKMDVDLDPSLRAKALAGFPDQVRRDASLLRAYGGK
jgi:beta-N-acetylhexosaminidase